MQKTLSGNPDTGSFLSHGPAATGKQLLSADRVAVWWLLLDEIRDADWEKLDSILIDEEQERSDRFHFERDRQVYIAAHAACRGLLSYCLGEPPRNWRFSVEDHGKPELICPPGQPRYRVNISHTRGLAAVALAREHDIGVDVEWLQRDAPADDLAKRMFAESERLKVKDATGPEKLETFLSFWTLKEAYVKAIGKGLSQPLDAFAFDLETDEISFRDGLADTAANWYFERYRPGPEHLMALAVRHPDKSSLIVDPQPAPLTYLLDLAGTHN
ncbi:4'-phosphopantetheinyl transferase superfamily protein [Stappia sp. BW2]|uniref:4'-phosphopantetheinyl transferase family protein n=1 Tax=Stappia sp. BW2 TaxID=2592622 RepID=UPI0011DEBD26|nr:4'-phosphopantetheinyl transferase superfamily protein [Stappia sp. BW2]TYC75452.1 4'-phosphopantetheinyl transferase superfamily protein [Stappia sp. BW2]